MDQIALPFRIALVAMIAVAALWMTVLKPKSATSDSAPVKAGQPTTGPTAPGVNGLVRATDKAKSAVATANAAGARAADPASTSTSTSTATATPAPAASAAPTAPPVEGVAPSDPSFPLVRALDDGKVAVVFFSGVRSADDRAARRAFAALSTRHGLVVKRRIPIAKVGRYEAITRGVKIDQSPTLLVMDPFRTARTIVGLTTARELDQRVGDAVATATPVRRLAAKRAQADRRAASLCGGAQDCQAFFAAANQACVTAGTDAVTAIGAEVTRNGYAGVPAVAQRSADQGATALAGVKAPAAQAGAQKQAVTILRGRSAAFGKAVAGVGKAADPKGAWQRAMRHWDRAPVLTDGNAELRRLGFAACG